MKKFFLMFLGVSGLVFSSLTWADCSMSGSSTSTTISIPATISLKQDVAAGTSLWKSGWQQQGGRTSSISCSNANMTTWNLENYKLISVSGQPNNIVKTNISGIGVRILWCNSGSCPENGGVWLTIGTSLLLSNYTSSGLIPTPMFSIEFIRTSEALDLSRGSQLSLPAEIVVAYGSVAANRLYISGKPIIQSRGCKVIIGNTNISVRMPNVNVTDFPSGTGVMANNNKAAVFNINLSCDSSINVSYKIDPQSSATVANVINNTAGTGYASGVGIQLFKGDTSSSTVLPLSTKQFHATTTSIGQAISIPVAAKYYKTSTSITGGLVRASALFTLFYE